MATDNGAPAGTLLRVPPFPGSHIRTFHPLAPASEGLHDEELHRCAELLRQHRVGGTFWGAQRVLPGRYSLVRVAAALPAVAAHSQYRAPLLWTDSAIPAATSGESITGQCDPWDMLDCADALVAEPDDEVGIIASILSIPVFTFDQSSGALLPEQRSLETRLRSALGAARVADPFTGEPMDIAAAIELCGFWRRLIDSNRDIAAGLGFAFWKQPSVVPLLWNGRAEIPFAREVPAKIDGRAVAVWRAKASTKAVAELRNRGLQLVEVEDGFLRSSGLGADCVPPLSITVDRLGAHFDPAQPSELEELLQSGGFDPALLGRARDLRETIVAEGLGKYERGTSRLGRPGGSARHILVPGQVEDDRSVMTGGGGLANLELLKRVRNAEPDAYILYKPHPDVVAGHRKGDIAEKTCLQVAGLIAADTPISSLLDMVDAVHVNTSLAGFEALMRGKPVTTHGVPFYAGWGLTTDLGPVPARRSARRTLDELVAATLLLYPRYLDPVTGLPCPAETVVRRLCADRKPAAGWLPAVRRLQGRLKRSLRILVP